MEIIDELEPHAPRHSTAARSATSRYSGNMDLGDRDPHAGRATADAHPRPGGRGHRRRFGARRRSTTRRVNKARGCPARRRAWPRRTEQTRVIAAAADRQLRLVHLQPRPVPGRARGQTCGSCATTRSPRTTSRRWRPSGIVISPGPCTPNEAGISLELIRRFAGRVPILGVCLGHQAIGQAFGGTVVRARAGRCTARPRRSSTTSAASSAGLPNPFEATRYHSLVDRARQPARRCSRSPRETWRRRDHGRALARTGRCAGRGRAVPSRVDPDGARARRCWPTFSR